MEILTGPACSGKTSALLHWYRAAIVKAQGERRPGRTLWLSPTHRVCQQVTQQLWANSASVILAPQVMTFDGFADRILQFSETVTRPLPPVMQRVLVRHLIDNHVATGRLKYFGGIAQTSGFLDVVLGLIAELKREEAWPEHFQAACAQRGASRSRPPQNHPREAFDARGAHVIRKARQARSQRKRGGRPTTATGAASPRRRCRVTSQFTQHRARGIENRQRGTLRSGGKHPAHRYAGT